MIECVFTLDYEVLGNGEGSLQDMIYAPADRLAATFLKHSARCVLFVEAAELDVIEAAGTDPAIDRVKRQLQSLHDGGFELGLHVHPQWYRGRYRNGRWLLDYDEYNLSTLPSERIGDIIDQAIGYLRRVLGDADYRPFSFRAGNWLFQPTQSIAQALIERGIKVDSSVFKGGLQHRRRLDYRPALKNGYWWPFRQDVNVPDPRGTLLEFPVYTTMVPLWRMLTAKRIGLQQRSLTQAQPAKDRLFRLWDYCRLRHPMKLDFCRMTPKELGDSLARELRQDQENPSLYRPIVAIGHTKDLTDVDTVDAFLSFLRSNGIPVRSFKDVARKCSPGIPVAKTGDGVK
jgi:hypothetical protein